MNRFRLLLILFLSVISQFPLWAQRHSVEELFDDAGEIYFSFQLEDRAEIEKLTHLLSIDNVRGNRVWAYANKDQFCAFINLAIPYELLTHPGRLLQNPLMIGSVDISSIESWDFYPTYDAYVDMMNQFAADFPGICELVNIGQSVEGRELLLIKISDNIGTREAEPQFLYTGTMHGDETTGYILLLRLIDHLLTNYGTDPDLTNLIDNTEIWINPLANPDGTYAGGNHTVSGATRNNANGVNLNRNYPDPDDGPHPDGHDWQPETLAFMQLAEDEHFVMAANTHGGAEVINYPWDTWQHLTADDDWWVYVCREYADTAHVYAPWYYLDGFDNGITNGYAWYTISGGRQDFMNYFHHCREVTMELSNTKLLPAAQLPAHWDWNHRSLINYIRQCTYGVAGVVTDAVSGEPLHAEVYIEGHDEDESQVWTDPRNGFYQRLLEAGTYDITFAAAGYMPVTIENVNVSRYATVHLDVQLDAGALAADFAVNENLIQTTSSVDFTDLSWGNPVSWEWHFEGAIPSGASVQNPSGITFDTPGRYSVSLTVTDAEGNSSTMEKPDYLVVAAPFNISDPDQTVCSGLFYDSGGASSNYSNNEDHTITILPSVPGSVIKLEFIEFDLEEHNSCSYDWLRIYDGNSTSAPLIGTFCGDNSPGAIMAENATGALTIEFHSDYSVTKPGWKALASSHATQQISLEPGWNGISTYLLPDDGTIENLFAGIADQLLIAACEDGLYYPVGNINTLGTWNRRNACWVKMNSAADLVIPGTLVENQVINLGEGWNFIPVPSNCTLPTEEFFTQLGDAMIMMKDAAGWRVYWPQEGITQLQELYPGGACLILMQTEGVFVIPDCE